MLPALAATCLIEYHTIEPQAYTYGRGSIVLQRLATTMQSMQSTNVTHMTILRPSIRGWLGIEASIAVAAAVKPPL